MIEISNVSKHYGKTPVLRNISAQLQSGTIYGLVGANGCGKTTLMRCICGFAKPDAGFVRVDGKVIGKDCDFAPSMGIIIETPGFLSHMTARQNLSILSRITGKVSDSQISDVIRRVGLDPDDRKPVGKYSLGMRQRLGIAQSLLETQPHCYGMNHSTDWMQPVLLISTVFCKSANHWGTPSSSSVTVKPTLQRLAIASFTWKMGRLSNKESIYGFQFARTRVNNRYFHYW